MKIILVGYGKMGKIIEQTAISRGHEISARIDIDNAADLAAAQGDVAIEFSHPDAAFDNLQACLAKGLPVVCGTTGWLSRREEIETLCKSVDGTFFYASNYSLGVNVFFKVNEHLARLMSGLPDYEIAIDETHHVEKRDAPSGTAISLAEGVLKYIKVKSGWSLKGQGDPSNIPIQSHRVDRVPGTHVITYASSVDSIEIKHTAHSREGFALGAVMVAEWLRSRKGVLGMDDYLQF
jgi:4-hydroxy-tetrahydrodipicolinate reductase